MIWVMNAIKAKQSKESFYQNKLKIHYPNSFSSCISEVLTSIGKYEWIQKHLKGSPLPDSHISNGFFQILICLLTILQSVHNSLEQLDLM